MRRKINDIPDKITRTNREFADRRIAELKRRLDEVEPRLAELEASADAMQTWPS